MDEVDQAQEREAFYQEKILKAALQADQHDDGDPLIIDGVRCCQNCEEPIDPKHLQVQPNAKRCVKCESRKERMAR